MTIRVLIIEDNPNNLELMNYLLQAFGYTTLQAIEGSEGLAAIDLHKPDLVLCDVQLPGIDGLDIIKHIKQQRHLSHIPIIAVTAFAMVGDKEKMLRAGFDGYIAKPITPETFIQEIEFFLSKHPTSRPRTESTLAPISAPQFEFNQQILQRLQGKWVLVVDDNVDDRVLTQTILEAAGCFITTANNIQLALNTLQQIKFDLIVSDVHLNGHRPDGYTLLKTVKLDPNTADVPFVLLSATCWRESERQQGLQYGAKKFIMRPIEPMALLTALAECFVETVGD